MEQVHLLIKNAKVFNSYLKKFISANVAVKEGKFYYIDRKQDTDFQADNVIDAKGSYMIPGLTDIHMHIESSMTTPGFFGKCAGENGVTTVVSEPHEMANVNSGNDLRSKGRTNRYFLRDSKQRSLNQRKAGNNRRSH